MCKGLMPPLRKKLDQLCSRFLSYTRKRMSYGSRFSTSMGARSRSVSFGYDLLNEGLQYFTSEAVRATRLTWPEDRICHSQQKPESGRRLPSRLSGKLWSGWVVLRDPASGRHRSTMRDRSQLMKHGQISLRIKTSPRQLIVRESRTVRPQSNTL